MNLLIVCSANMHRSALAEAMIREAIRALGRDDVSVSSRGTSGVTGMQAVAEAVALAEEIGLDLRAHRSRGLEDEEIDGADLILVMESDHRQEIIARRPDSEPRCRLLSEYAGPDAGIERGEDIPDAIGAGMDAFRRTFRAIRSCVRGLIEELPEPPQDVYARAVEERLRTAQRTPLTLPPADWQRIDRWWQRRIPLWIVIESLDEVFRRKDEAKGPKRIFSLSYCEPIIEERLKAHQRTRIEPPPAPRTERSGAGAAAQRMSGLMRAAASAAEERGEREAARLIEGAADHAAALDVSEGTNWLAELARIEEQLIESLRAVTRRSHVEAMERAAAAQLDDHRDRMTPAAYQTTIRRHVDRQIRDLYALPDIGQIDSIDPDPLNR